MSTVYWRGFPAGTSGKEAACQCRKLKDSGSIHVLGRSPGGGHSNTLQYYCLENFMTEEPGRLQSIGLQRLNKTEAT